ncbi:MAG: SDR family NAD(P)-dependent oxidoreductase [Pseudomonadota bacterium]
MAERSVLITGCSTGIGHHAAHALKARGWRVFATCRRESDCARLREEGLESFALDVTLTPSIEAGVARVLEETGGRLDALFNNAAHMMPGAIEDLPTQGLREIFEANFFGWHTLTQAVLPTMRAQGHGRILQNSSILGFAALPMRGAYNSTKFALEGYSDTLRLELAPAGIHVMLLEPGPIGTAIRQNAQGHYARWTRKNGAWARFYRKELEPRLYDTSDKKDFGELTCEATTKKVIHALETPTPRLHYPVTFPTWAMVFARRLFPARFNDKVILAAELRKPSTPRGAGRAT